MGRKTGYATAILRVMGLRPGGKAARYLWAEADGDVAALLAAYTQPEKMREIAALIRSWIPCPYGPHLEDPSCSRCKGTGRWDARDLWEVLRREKRRGLWEGFEPASVAMYAAISEGCYEVRANGGTSGFKNERAEGGYYKDHSILPERFSALPWPPVLIAQDAAVNVGSVAGWARELGWSLREDASHFKGAIVEAEVGWAEWAGPGMTARQIAAHGVGPNGRPMRSRGMESEPLADGFARSRPVWPPVHLTPDAAIPVPARLPEGTVCYIDPDYQGTTGYKHTFPRAAVIETALRWHNAGARVYISEAEPIPIPGWFHVEIGGERVGQARTFTRSASEWLTCSHPPAWRPAVQAPLFGTAAPPR